MMWSVDHAVRCVRLKTFSYTGRQLLVDSFIHTIVAFVYKTKCNSIMKKFGDGKVNFCVQVLNIPALPKSY